MAANTLDVCDLFHLTLCFVIINVGYNPEKVYIQHSKHLALF